MKALKIIICIVVFAALVALVIVGQQNVGWPGLLVMFLGLAGLIAMLSLYNKKYQ